MTKQLKCYYLLLIRYYKLSLLNQFLEGYSIMAAWGNNFFKKNFFLLFFHFSAPLKCHWPIRASSLKSHSPAGRIYSPLATGRVLMKRLCMTSRPPPFLKSQLFKGHLNVMRCTVHDTRLGSLNLVYGFIYRQILFLTACALGLTGDLWPTKLLVRLQREVYAPLVR